MSFPGLLPPPQWERRVSYSIFVKRVEERTLGGDTVSPRSGYFNFEQQRLRERLLQSVFFWLAVRKSFHSALRFLTW